MTRLETGINESGDGDRDGKYLYQSVTSPSPVASHQVHPAEEAISAGAVLYDAYRRPPAKTGATFSYSDTSLTPEIYQDETGRSSVGRYSVNFQPIFHQV